MSRWSESDVEILSVKFEVTGDFVAAEVMWSAKGNKIVTSTTSYLSPMPDRRSDAFDVIETARQSMLAVAELLDIGIPDDESDEDGGMGWQR